MARRQPPLCSLRRLDARKCDQRREEKQHIACRVRQPPGPAAIHQGVAELLGDMKRLAAAPASVAVTYWIVEARPADESEVDPALAEIRAPLMKASGGSLVDFTAVERVTLRSAHDVGATHEGRSAEVR